MKKIIETQRLYLRTFTVDDAGLILALNGDPAVTEYTGDGIVDLEQARAVLTGNILPQYTLFNCGRWAVHLKQSGEFIGWCGLKNRPERQEIDLGYRFLREAWGQGFATESAAACLRYGFETLKLRRIVGRAMPANQGSIQVLEKIGMRFCCEEIVDGHSARIYEAINPFFP